MRAWQSAAADKLRVSAGRSDLFGRGNTETHAKRLPFCRPPSFISCQFFFFFLRFISCCQNQEPGTEPLLRGWKKTRFASRLWGCFTGFISLWRKSDPGAERCAKKPRSSSSLLSVLSISPSINLSTHPLLSICLSICFHVLGPCDFAKMHHQQRMAALGTDKELSDLLDFSAVRKSTFFSYR